MESPTILATRWLQACLCVKYSLNVEIGTTPREACFNGRGTDFTSPSGVTRRIRCWHDRRADQNKAGQEIRPGRISDGSSIWNVEQKNAAIPGSGEKFHAGAQKVPKRVRPSK